MSVKRVSNSTCLKVISFENEHEKKHMDPNPNHSDDLATFLHITKSTILSQRPSHSDCSTKTVPVCQKRKSYCGMLSKFEIEPPITINSRRTVNTSESSEQ